MHLSHLHTWIPLHYFPRSIKVEKFGMRVIQNSRGFLGGRFQFLFFLFFYYALILIKDGGTNIWSELKPNLHSVASSVWMHAHDSLFPLT